MSCKYTTRLRTIVQRHDHVDDERSVKCSAREPAHVAPLCAKRHAPKWDLNHLRKLHFNSHARVQTVLRCLKYQVLYIFFTVIFAMPTILFRSVPIFF